MIDKNIILAKTSNRGEKERKRFLKKTFIMEIVRMNAKKNKTMIKKKQAFL